MGQFDPKDVEGNHQPSLAGHSVIGSPTATDGMSNPVKYGELIVLG